MLGVIIVVENFVREWSGRGYEKGETQVFWLGLLRETFGVSEPEKIIEFEVPVPIGYIDALIRDTKILIEQKSKSVKLDKTVFQQAKKYNDAIGYSSRTRWIVTCNFQEFLIYDMEKLDAPLKILLEELPKKIKLLDFLVDPKYKKRPVKDISVEAGERVEKLYETLKKIISIPIATKVSKV